MTKITHTTRTSGATKIACEAMLRSYHHRYDLDYVGLRYMNVYGLADYHGAYIAVIMKMLTPLTEVIARPVVMVRRRLSRLKTVQGPMFAR